MGEPSMIPFLWVERRENPILFVYNLESPKRSACREIFRG